MRAMTSRTAPDETTSFTPRFDSHGLLGAIVVDDADGAVLMFAHMNAEALRKTQDTGFIHFWSRSRQVLWKKGETSGETFRVRHILVDCDQDCLVVRVSPQGHGRACHTGRRSCFYRALVGGALRFVE